MPTHQELAGIFTQEELRKAGKFRLGRQLKLPEGITSEEVFQEVNAEFLKKYPECLNPKYAAARCHFMSLAYRDMVGGRLVYCVGHKLKYPHRAKLWNKYPNPDRDFSHTMNFAFGKYIDWTARQLDPKLPVPFVLPNHQAVKELWRRASFRDFL